MRHGDNPHRVNRIGWLRAGVLGANDGIVSTAALIVGIAAASTDRHGIILAGTAALVAGAMSMAAGEYVSVSSQADTEKADLELEKRHLADDPAAELEELAGIWRDRGLSAGLALEVAKEFTAKDALAAHARDELGLSDEFVARPVQAAVTSALTFSAGAALPLAAALLAPPQAIILAVSVASLLFLAGLGAVGAALGGAPRLKASVRVAFWGAVALGATALVGRLFGAAV
ncbi:VIT1/CCC1 transporter family protein [Sandaracinobacteroides hominis]|uniref:VIT1/CCC1 transporter family protein n=1 Tax=Sandaracinobacteroides hominis TaxID=2780086 RepID=UPI0018F636C6|nr:VIT family protein [Sandaracinobacteroides hominis]